MSKNTVETEGPQMTSQYSAYALRVGLARLYARMRMHTPTRSGTRTHSHACAHRPISNAYCFSAATMIRKRASLLPYMYISPLVSFYNVNKPLYSQHNKVSAFIPCVIRYMFRPMLVIVSLKTTLKTLSGWYTWSRRRIEITYVSCDRKGNGHRAPHEPSLGSACGVTNTVIRPAHVSHYFRFLVEMT